MGLNNYFNSVDAIILGAIFATIGWIYTSHRARHLARKHHTIDILLRGQFSTALSEAQSDASLLFTGTISFPELYTPRSDTDLTENYTSLKLINSLRIVLNYYEVISSLIRLGEIDERIVKSILRGSILKAFISSERYIYQLRQFRNNPHIYKDIEWLYSKWND